MEKWEPHNFIRLFLLSGAMQMYYCNNLKYWDALSTQPLKRQAKFVADDIFYFLIFERKQDLILHVTRLPSRRFT